MNRTAISLVLGAGLAIAASVSSAAALTAGYADRGSDLAILGGWGGHADGLVECKEENGQIVCRPRRVSVGFHYSSRLDAEHALKLKFDAMVDQMDGRQVGSLSFSISVGNDAPSDLNHDQLPADPPVARSDQAPTVPSDAEPQAYAKPHWTNIGPYTYGWKLDYENTHALKTLVLVVELPNERDPFKPLRKRFVIHPCTAQTIGLFRTPAPGSGRIIEAHLTD